MTERTGNATQAAEIHAGFMQAVTHHQRGQLAEARALYEALLTRAPEHFDALHLLGVLHHQQGDNAAALKMIERAILLRPGEPAAHSNLGLVLQALGRAADAVASYDRAVALKPDFAEALFNRGNALMSLGQPAAALESYDRALAVRPETAETLNARALALMGLGRNEDARTNLDRALALRPAYPEALLNRGVTLSRLSRHLDAVSSFDAALALRPDYPEALSNRGGALAALGRHPEAFASFDRALAMRPDFVDALVNRGAFLNRLGRADQALENLDRALALAPARVDALVNRGAALIGLDRPGEALASLEKALAHGPDHVEALNNQGSALRMLGRKEAALASFDQALAIDPDNVDALVNRGAVLRELRRVDEAIASQKRALERMPGHADALIGLGNSLAQQKRTEEALACYDQALALQPDLPDALVNRGAALRDLKRHAEAAQCYARLLEIEPDYPYARGYGFHSQMQTCNWQGRAASVAQLETGVLEGRRVDAPFSFLSVSDSATAQLNCARTWAADKCPATPDPVWNGARYAHDRIRIAYLSADFGEHPVAYCVAELFEIHDRSQFEVVGVSFGPDNRSAMRSRLQGGVDRFIDAQEMSDRAVARMLCDMEIDIAVDLNGHTQGNRAGVFAQRAAPVQVNYLGYSGSMGAPYIDYIIGDGRVIPQGQEAFYSEKVVRLPDTYLVNDRKRAVAGSAPTRAEAGLPAEGFVFCCFNNSYKITPAVFDLWMRLLGRIEGSVLWLFEDNAAAAGNLGREAEARGIDARRLVFARRTPLLSDHLARYRLADLFLDTLPYNAHVTTIDALWTGLPVLTCMGGTFAGRVAGSLLHAAGLPELVANTPEDYEARAVRLASDAPQRGALKARLEAHRADFPLFDTDRFRRHIESAYATMHARSQRGLAPEAFEVNAIG